MGAIKVLSLLLFIIAGSAHAYQIPKGLTSDDRQQIVQTLGLSTSTKLLNNPYPLGGYSGFEIGYSVEYINVRDLRELGCEPGSPGCANTSYNEDSEWRISRLTLGKGLYHNVDVFFHFVPPVGKLNYQDYGVAGRWMFYQAKFLPIHLSLLGHFNQLNFADQFTNRNLGLELIAGVNVENFAIYFGGGQVQAIGRFVGAESGGSCGTNCTVDVNSGGIDPVSRVVTTKASTSHIVVGINLQYQNMFFSAQVDRYIDSVYSLKTGLRF